MPKINIDNTNNLFNLELIDKSTLEEDFLITNDNKHLVEEALIGYEEANDLLNPRDEKRYIYDASIMERDDTFMDLVFRRAGYVTYRTNSGASIPLQVIQYESRYLYNTRIELILDEPIKDNISSDVARASAANKLDVVVNSDDWNTYELILELDKIKYIVDSVTITTNRKTPEEYYNYFHNIRDALSAWKMLIKLSYSDKNQKEYVEKKAKADERKMKTRTVW